MINKDLIKEVSNFMRMFLMVFESENSKSFISKDNPALDDSHFFAFKISGELSGYLVGFIKPEMKPKYNCAEQILLCYNSLIKDSKKISLCNMGIIGKRQCEEILYTMRRANPEVAIKVEMNYYTVHFIIMEHDMFFCS